MPRPSRSRRSASRAPLEIRVCRDADLEEVARLYRCWEAEGITWGLTDATVDELRAKLGPFFLVAERGGELIGFAAGRLRRTGALPPDNLAVYPGGAEYLEVEELYVAVAARNAGIGTRLVEGLLEEARRHGVDHSTTFSATKATGQIIRFYERLGYRPWGVQFFK